jgi:penicillin-binding protein 1B
MEGVIDHGTGAGVRARGFKLPAAGKTGTSRDGWFCRLHQGSADDSYKSHPARDAAHMAFLPPPGIEMADIDASLLLATPYSQKTFTEAFIAGTAPTTTARFDH